eukprot:Gregarina_sp_Poly_1__10959@NODE_862_length_5940_cov_638_515410_g285_i2_p1_GENE_NODE_862_length_5940_cov_638_515410_g285_i2NODE_862_length_5940_cov_638_515410_g285_i2_p1_ORF_typecomplete_len548_score89_92GHMP_kinases_C/PF08544_13/2_9e21GalKase_gal_bdg/PF10509_9/3_4e16GalKase_gal_bdg/PF10509_9/3_3e03GHMP_kinases_N/PF00288_26/2_5e11_NODE_862_length_5940_cov_638_515410_g285_i235485191
MMSQAVHLPIQPRAKTKRLKLNRPQLLLIIVIFYSLMTASETSHIFQKLESQWSSFYPNDKINFTVQAPGRVNLIGEHVDHQAYPVCPCAISQTVCAAVSFSPHTGSTSVLQLKHVDYSIYPTAEYKDVSEMKVVDEKVWTNYITAAYFGVVEYYINGRNPDTIGQAIEPKKGLTAEQIEKSQKVKESPVNYSIKILFAGDVPPAAGLSSSAAVVVATTLAAAHVGGSRPSNSVLADVCAKAERYTGVASGGMDQAAILLSVKDSATLIHFKPLSTKGVKLPKGGVLIIANTCREAPKAKMAAKMYNKRVFELKAGCLALLPINIADSLTADQLLDIQIRDVVRDYLKMTEKELLEELPKRLSEKVWTREDMLKIMGKERCDILLTKRCGQGVWDQNDDFHVFKRVRHVLSEAIRVEDFAQTTESTTMSDEEKLRRLGELMNGSGNSLNDDFDCSCPEIEQVVAIARKHGAYGSRLTGAGWGGCTVSLVPENKKDEVLAAIAKEYFEPHFAGKVTDRPPLECLPSREALSTCLFTTAPSQGAFIVDY